MLFAMDSRGFGLLLKGLYHFWNTIKQQLSLNYEEGYMNKDLCFEEGNMGMCKQ
jgi:hypothetical protein